MRKEYMTFRFTWIYLFFITIQSFSAVTITWDPVTKDINNNDETGTIYYYVFCKESADEPVSWSNWVAATTETTIVYSDERQSNPDITLYYQVVAVDEYGNSSEPITGGDESLPVNLALFEIAEKDGQVILKWSTASELDVAGFNLLRSEQVNGNYVKVNPQLVPGKGTFTSLSHYEYIDDDVSSLQVYYYKLQAVDIDGSTESFGPYSIFVQSGVPQSYTVTQNYPNPFNPQTSISYSVPEESRIEISVYNIFGEHVTTLVDGKKSTGTFTVSWDGRDHHGVKVASGKYFYKFKTPQYTAVKAMTLLK